MRANGRLARCLLARRTGEWLSRSASQIKRGLNRCSAWQVIDDVGHRRVNDPRRRHRRLTLDGEDCADRRNLLLQRLFRLPRFLWLLTPSALGNALSRLDPSPVFGLGTQAQEARGGLQIETQPLIYLAKNGPQHIAVSRGQQRGLRHSGLREVENWTLYATCWIGRDAQSILNTPELISASEPILNLDAGGLP
jgi:hypothetical protein